MNYVLRNAKSHDTSENESGQLLMCKTVFDVYKMFVK